MKSFTFSIVAAAMLAVVSAAPAEEHKPANPYAFLKPGVGHDGLPQ
jgi:hypothetical protein